jgi:hypothetical protein
MSALDLEAPCGGVNALLLSAKNLISDFDFAMGRLSRASKDRSSLRLPKPDTKYAFLPTWFFR